MKIGHRLPQHIFVNDVTTKLEIHGKKEYKNETSDCYPTKYKKQNSIYR